VIRFLPVLALGLALAACSGGAPGDAPEDAAVDAAPVDVAQEAQRIQPGMTKADVVGILGEPRTTVGESDGERLTFWTFDDSQRVRSRVYVTFDAEGKVVDVETVDL
jgi:outer membrane protein assembly factor BamE (lipoprotein component of BamABCDE complex)